MSAPLKYGGHLIPAHVVLIKNNSALKRSAVPLVLFLPVVSLVLFLSVVPLVLFHPHWSSFSLVLFLTGPLSPCGLVSLVLFLPAVPLVFFLPAVSPVLFLPAVTLVLFLPAVPLVLFSLRSPCSKIKLIAGMHGEFYLWHANN